VLDRVCAAWSGFVVDRRGQYVERHGHSPARWRLYRQPIMSAPHILYQCMPRDDHSGTAVLLEPPHRSQPRLQPTVVALNPVVGVPIGSVLRRRQQLLEYHRIGRCLRMTVW
jgi:hypothetical protein